MAQANSKQQIGIYIATSLVVGNMIGSGIYMLPANLAQYGGISIFGWLISGAGAILIALLFGRLSKLVPKTGGPYQYPKEGFGEFAGFLSGWGYWVSILLTNASIATIFSSYLLVFLPSWQGSHFAHLFITLAAIWGLTWVNTRGVHAGGKLQLVTTLLKVVPLLALTIAGLFYFNPAYFVPMNESGQSDLAAIAASVTLTLFAFLGIESATVPAGNIKSPKTTIPRATLLGTLFTIGVYVLASITIMGMMPHAALAKSSAPLADAAYILWGDFGTYFVGVGAVVSTFGALNGWILVQGQIPLSMADDKLMPPVFNRLSKQKFPVLGLVLSSGLISIIVLTNQSKGLVELFALLILLSTFLALISYLFSSLAEVQILIRQQPAGWRQKLIPAFIAGMPVFGFVMWAFYGSGLEIVFYGFMALILGIPFYIWAKIEQTKI